MRASSGLLLSLLLLFAFGKAQIIISTPNASITNVWLTLVGQFQRDISLHTPINELTLPCAHNAYNNPKNLPPLLMTYQNLFLLRGNVILQNQDLTMTQLLNLGVRHLSLDVHFIPKYNQTLLCHGSSESSFLCPIIEAGFGATCKEAVGIEDLGGHTGCTLDAATWDEGLEEIQKWVEKNPDEYLWLEIEDQASMEDYAIEDQLSGPILSRFGPRIFTRTDYEHFLADFPDSEWPSPYQMRAIYNKTIVISGFFDRFPSIIEVNMPILSTPSFPYDMVKDFEPTTCNYLPSNFSQFYESDIQVVLNFLGLNVDESGHKQVGEITEKTMRQLLDCGFAGCADRISPVKMVSTIWTWSQEFSPIACEENLCPVLHDGFWKHAHCNNTFFAACQNDTNSFDWLLLEPFAFENVTCPAGFTFTFPVTSLQNRALKDASNGQAVWLNVPLQFDPKHPVCSYVPISSSPLLSPSLLSLSLLSFLVFAFFSS